MRQAGDLCFEFWGNEDGATAIEYSLIVALCSTAMIGGLYGIRTYFNESMGGISDVFKSSMP